MTSILALEAQIILDKSAKGPLSISECHAQGNYIIIQNTSRSKVIDLTGWKIYQENENDDQCLFTFPNHCLLKPNHSLKVIELHSPVYFSISSIRFSAKQVNPNNETTI